MSSEQSNILKRQEQLNLWFDSETDRAPNSIKEAEKIKFPKEVQFFSACNSNDWSEIERLLDDGIDINCTQDDGLTALHQACIDDDENLVKYLVTHGAKIDAQDKEGWTPLFAAISCNYLPITNYLISCNARLDVVSFDGELPLDQSNNEAMTSFLVEELKKRNLDPNEIRNRERNAMLNEVEKIKINKDFSNFTMVDNGATMLHVAASKDYIDVLENLLAIITPELLNQKDNDGWNALHVAAHWNHRRACIILVEAEIDFDSLTSSNQTVLEVADDEVKPYLREEIRKARFRRDEKASIKRPAPSPNGEFQPSVTKIICHEKINQISIESKQVNGDKSVTITETSLISTSHDNQKSNQKSLDENKESVSNVDPVDLKLNSIDVTHKTQSDPTDSESKITTPSLPTSTSEINENSQPVQEKSDHVIYEKSDSKTKIKSIESESQRKDKARHVRSTRRSTQGVTAEDIDEAKKLMSTVQKQEKFNMPSQISTIMENKNDTSEMSTILNHSIRSNQSEPIATNEESSVNIKESVDTVPKSPIVTSPMNLLSETSESQPVDIASDLSELNDRKKRTGSHLVNKRRTRERPPTGTIDLKDIQAAQSEVKILEEAEKSLDNRDSSKTVVKRLSEVKILEEAEKSLDNRDSSKTVSLEIDYKQLYELECKEKDKLLRNLTRIRKELQESQDQIRLLQNNSIVSKNNKIPQKSVAFQSDSDVKEVEKLREENRKMKEANSALIRVISRLSHPPVVTKSTAGST